MINKDFETGGLMNSVAKRYLPQGLEILASSENIPQFPLCASPLLSIEERDKVIEALLGCRDRRVFENLGKKIIGFARIARADYDSIRKMLRDLE